MYRFIELPKKAEEYKQNIQELRWRKRLILENAAKNLKERNCEKCHPFLNTCVAERRRGFAIAKSFGSHMDFYEYATSPRKMEENQIPEWALEKSNYVDLDYIFKRRGDQVVKTATNYPSSPRTISIIDAPPLMYRSANIIKQSPSSTTSMPEPSGLMGDSPTSSANSVTLHILAIIATVTVQEQQKVMPKTEAQNVVNVRGSGQRHKLPEHFKQVERPEEKTEGLTGGQGEFGQAWAEEAPEE
ncbi:Oidioi.mRNA.OKI2018_I69.PAR.g10332.t1.cds [Oikopleura dioica]|uniref:Oidioi.mRNA.OKI2018_I69.PAR.g10332.t1.cds n=1 Tax=Oikopleura dioica TaxID=34765 RepID=A0ABN7RVU2_OIKDI|nr:Oidioi.mRNA.OKI2018_I69.PAR.g10332.t1.cds [Oikopleura dioica]